MATIVLGIAGAVAGGMIAGPGGAVKGAMMGWSIGTTVGSFIDQSQQHFYTADMGRTADLRVTVASYGTSIPQCWGQVRVPGIVIWTTDLQEHEQDQNSGGGSGGPKVTTRVYTYTVSFAMAFCKGGRMQANSIKRIYADDLIVYDSSQAPNLNNITPRFYTGTETQSADPLIIASASNSDIPAGSDNPAFRGLCYMVVQDMLLTDFGNRMPNFSVLLDTGQLYVSDVITDILTQVGVGTADIDVSQVTDIAITGGIVASRIDAKSAILPFLTAYNVDLIDVDGKIKAIPRGQAPVATITFDDMGAQTLDSGTAQADKRITKTRLEDTELPKRVDIGYYSPTINLQQATQGAIRQSAVNNNYVSISLPLSLTDVEARQIAERQLYLPWIEKMKYETDVLPKFSNLCPTDVVWVQSDANGTLQRARIIEAEAGMASEIKLSLVRDDDSNLTQIAVSSTPGSGQGLTDSSVVPTTFFAWSGTELRNEDQNLPGIYVAATGNSNWQGCSILVSTDGGTTYQTAGSSGTRAIFGTVSNALASDYTPNANGFDATNTVNVVLNSGDILTSTSETLVLNGSGNFGLILDSNTNEVNTADYEVFGFANVSLVSGSTYTLSDLLRTQRNTAATGHTATDRFVLLNSAVQRINGSSSLVDKTVYVKCVSPGQDPTAVTAQAVLVSAATPTALQKQVDSLQNTVDSQQNTPSVPAWLFEKLNVDEPGAIAPISDLTAFTPTIAIPLTTPNGNLNDLNSSGASRTTAWGMKAVYSTELTVIADKTIELDCTADNSANCTLIDATGVTTVISSGFGNGIGPTTTSPGTFGYPIRLALNLKQGRNIVKFQFYQDNDAGGSNSGLTIIGVGGSLASLVDEQLAPGAEPSGGGGGGGTVINFADAEIPAGTINGTNAAFTLAHTPNPVSSLRVVLRRQERYLTSDYTYSNGTITFVSEQIPQTGDDLYVWYRY